MIYGGKLPFLGLAPSSDGDFLHPVTGDVEYVDLDFAYRSLLGEKGDVQGHRAVRGPILRRTLIKNSLSFINVFIAD